MKESSNALTNFTKRIKMDPNDADAYNNRGLIYYNLKDYSNALADYT
jgi:regulator of sirC expression with transglutaminase-like and TPR domain